MVSSAYHLEDSDTFIQKALQWAAAFDCACYLDSNGYHDQYGNLHAFLAVGASASFTSDGQHTFQKLQEFIDAHPHTWIPGFFGYDLKNDIEGLESRHPNRTEFPDAYFFVPAFVLLIGRYNVEIKGENPDAVYWEITETEITDSSLEFRGHLQYRMNRSAYLAAFSE